MEKKTTKFTEKEIVNLEILKKMDGAYCYKQDENGNVSQYGYICFSYLHLFIIDDLTNFQAKVYVWNTPENLNVQNANRHKICLFLSELAVKPLLEKGKPFEKEQAVTMWQLYSPQEGVPQELVDCVKSIKRVNK